jgi:hypothetical protein
MFCKLEHQVIVAAFAVMEWSEKVMSRKSGLLPTAVVALKAMASAFALIWS